MISRILHLRSFRIAAVVYLLVSLLCTRIPLVNVLGYEFSFVIALATTWIGAWLAFREIRPVYRRPGSSGGDATMVAFRRSLAANLLLLVVPVVILTANAALVRNCSFVLGLGFYILLPVVTACFATSLALLCVVHYRFARTAYGFIVGATLLYAAALGYWTPAIFSYNFFYGFFPGFTYDEILELRWPLVTFRIVTLFVAFVLVAMAHVLMQVANPWDSVPRKGTALARALVRPGRRFLTVGGALIIGVIYLFRCDLGYESTASYIRNVLGSEYTTEHFTLYYDATSIDTSEIHWIAAEHEFCLSRALDVFVLPHRTTVASYIYPSAEAKQRLIGAGNTSIAKPWSREVHCALPALDAVLQHEIIHVVAGTFGVPVLRASLSPGVTEGVATAFAGDGGTWTLHQEAAAIRRAGIVTDVKPLFSVTGFVTQSSSVSYVLAGSFCRYLIDRFGIRKMALLYGQSDFDATYGRSLERLLRDWGQFLERYPELPAESERVDAFFRRPPIFGKICARVIAARNADARDLFIRKDYAGASALYEQSYTQSGNQEALYGWLSSALRSSRYSVLTSVYDSVVVSAVRPAEYLPLFLQIGDAFWAQDSTMSALRLYDRVQRADLSRAYTEAALLRALAIDDASLAPTLRRYFLSGDPDSVRIRMLDSLSAVVPGDPILRLLRGRAQLRLERYEEALSTLSGFDVGETDTRLEAGRRLAVAQALFRLKRFQDAKAAFWTSLNAGYSEAAEASAQRWIDRCDWLTEHGLP